MPDSRSLRGIALHCLAGKAIVVACLLLVLVTFVQEESAASSHRQRAFLTTLKSLGLQARIWGGNTLIVTISDVWYDLRDFQKRRLVKMVAGGFIGARVQDGVHSDSAGYVFVDVKDRYGEKVAAYSAWTGIHILR